MTALSQDRLKKLNQKYDPNNQVPKVKGMQVVFRQKSQEKPQKNLSKRYE